MSRRKTRVRFPPGETSPNNEERELDHSDIYKEIYGSNFHVTEVAAVVENHFTGTAVYEIDEECNIVKYVEVDTVDIDSSPMSNATRNIISENVYIRKNRKRVH